MSEPKDVMLRRMMMRSMRRGTKEMDIILQGFAEAELAGLSDAELAVYDALLSENDHDLYAWITGQSPAPEQFSALISRISVRSDGIVRPAS